MACTFWANLGGWGMFSDCLRNYGMSCRYHTCSTQDTARRVRSPFAKLFPLLFWLGICSVVFVLPQSTGRTDAADTGTSRYDLVVLPRLTGRLRIVAPADTTLTHDGTDNDQPFGLQQWAVRANANRGATVTFETRTAFRNTTAAGTVKRDARIQMGIDSQDAGGDWAVTQATDQTNYLAGDEFAIVSARSTQRGDATFDIYVTFVTSDFSTLRAGIYSTTVIGTISAN